MGTVGFLPSVGLALMVRSALAHDLWSLSSVSDERAIKNGTEEFSPFSGLWRQVWFDQLAVIRL